MDAIGQVPSEAKRLLWKLFAAQAEAQGMMIGTKKIDNAAILATASSIEARTIESQSLL